MGAFFYVHVGEMEERGKGIHVCRLTNVTVLRLFFFFFLQVFQDVSVFGVAG